MLEWAGTGDILQTGLNSLGSRNNRIYGLEFLVRTQHDVDEGLAIRMTGRSQGSHKVRKAITGTRPKLARSVAKRRKVYEPDRLARDLFDFILTEVTPVPSRIRTAVGAKSRMQPQPGMRGTQRRGEYRDQ